MHRINMTLVCFLIFTIISSGLAYKIVISAYASYDTFYEVDTQTTIKNKKISNTPISEQDINNSKQ